MHAIKSKLVELYDATNPQERCGVLTETGEIIEITNVHNEPEAGFRMDPSELIKALDGEDEVVATWHTHPDADPNLSQEDYAGFLQWPDLVHLIVGMRDGKVEVDIFKVEEGLVLRCD